MANQAPTRGEIRRAKTQAVGGGRKRCRRGKNCSAACIQAGMVCLVEMPESAGLATTKIKNFLLSAPKGGEILRVIPQGDKPVAQSQGSPASPYKDWQQIAVGNYGRVSRSLDGKRVVKELLEHEGVKKEFGPHERQLARKMGELGHSPRIFSDSDNHIEMDLAPGMPVWKSYAPSGGEGPMTANQARKAAAAVKDLHALGFFHGDAHALQWMVEGNSVKLVDYGLSGKISDNPVKALQDLSKWSKVVGWDNPELAKDPYVDLVNWTLKKYGDISGQSKAAKAQREQLAKLYLSELAALNKKAPASAAGVTSQSLGDYAPIKRLTGEELVNTAWKLSKEGKTPAEIVKATGYWKDNESFNKAIKEYRPKTKERLEGDKLIETVKNLPPEATKPDIVRAAGYSSWGPNGKEKLHWSEFYEALLNAKELPEFKQAGGYLFRQKINPIPEKELPTKEKLQKLLKVDEWEVSDRQEMINKLLGSGAKLRFDYEKKGPEIGLQDGVLTLTKWVGLNKMELSADEEGKILWEVNGSVSRDNNQKISPKEKRQMAIEARKTWDTLLRGFDKDTILTTNAYTGDGGGESRARAYQAMGFGEPEGGPGGEQYGQITGNGLRPLDPEEGRERYQEQYGMLDGDDEDNEYYNWVREDDYGDDDDDNDYAEVQSESSKQLDNKAIDDAFMVILFGDTGTEKI